MAPRNKIIIGFLTILIISTASYINLGDDVRMRVDCDRTTIYVPHDDYPWIWTVAGREYYRLFDGSSIMNRKLNSCQITTEVNPETKDVIITRFMEYQRGPSITSTYTYNGNLNNVEQFPIQHTDEVKNAQGFFYRYSVDELARKGGRVALKGDTELNFEKNIKVELNPGYRWAWIGWPYGGDSVAAQYDIESDYEIFNVRLFDPPYELVQDCTYDFWQEPIYKTETLYRNITTCSNEPINSSCSQKTAYLINETTKIGEVTKNKTRECRTIGIKINDLQLDCPKGNFKCDVIKDVPQFYSIETTCPQEKFWDTCLTKELQNLDGEEIEVCTEFQTHSKTENVACTQQIQNGTSDVFCAMDCNAGDCNYGAKDAKGIGRGWAYDCIPIPNEIKEGKELNPNEFRPGKTMVKRK